MTQLPHTTVLLSETVAAMRLAAGGLAIDCTTGAGGHTQELVDAVGDTGRVFGLDRDDTALSLASTRLASAVASGRVKLVKARFSDVAQVAADEGVFGKVDAICADIGVSSMHIDQADRGFSFQKDGPLDMRMDRASGRTAAELIADSTEAELADIFFKYGEEPKARAVARRISQEKAKRPIETTLELANIVKQALPYLAKSKKHPATKVFQALRIAVNDELGELERMIDGAFDALRPGGRLAVISFHSLEDRIVKNAFLALTARREKQNLPRGLPLTDSELQSLVHAKGDIVKPFPLVPSDDEISQNPRARSAKLRVVEKLGARLQ